MSLEKLKALAQRKARLEAEMARLTKAAREETRRLETRRKIILGAELLAVAVESPQVARLIEHLVNNLKRPADRAAFKGWQLPGGLAQPSPALPPTIERDGH